MRIVVAGVAGSGKSTVGTALAERLGGRFVDGDSLHPAANVEKMTAGRPLDEDDRWPWLDTIVETMRAEASIVVACSALTLRSRDRLRLIPGVRFVLLDLEEAEAAERVEARANHFMSPALVASQFSTLERPGREEVDVATVDASADLFAVIDAAVVALLNLDR